MTQTDLNWGAILPDLPDVSANQELIPPGNYICAVEKAEAGISQNGNAKIELTFKVTEAPHANRKIWGRINFASQSKDSMAITVAQLAEFGLSRQWLATHNPTTAQIAGKLVGTPISVRLQHREYQGKMYYDVKGYSRVEGTAAAGAFATPAAPTPTPAASGVPF